MRLRLLGASAALLAGCTILYNPDNLPATDAAEIDAAIDAPTDADPSQFDITSVEPTEIDEGVGAAGGRPALFVLHGTSIVAADAQVSVGFVADASGDAGVSDGGVAMPMQVAFDVAASATQGGVAVRLPVMPELREGQTAILRITIVQHGTTKMQDVTVHGRDELTLTAANQLTRAIYSQITVGGNVHFAGTSVIRLRATAGITFNALVDGDAAGATPGPHGCAGGAVDMPGGCGTGGGTQGANASALGLSSGSGGGGGGFAGVATGGSGQMSGAAGGVTGNEMLLPVESVAGQIGNRGNGGGGGGTLAAGGAGGGGGGVIYVQAGGDITVGASGLLRAAGGNGLGAGGGGGGGSGGALLVRSGGTIVASTRWLSTPPGAGATGQQPGGAGSVGRIRIDTGGGDVAAMANNPTAVQGPAWSASVPLVTSAAPFTAQLRGQPGRPFELRLNDVAAGAATPGAAGTVNVTGLVLAPGRNELCAVALAGDLSADSLSCIDVFFTGG